MLLEARPGQASLTARFRLDLAAMTVYTVCIRDMRGDATLGDIPTTVHPTDKPTAYRVVLAVRGDSIGVIDGMQRESTLYIDPVNGRNH